MRTKIIGLSTGDSKIVLDWIEENIYPRKTELTGVSSYGLKHIMTRETGIYVTNNQFKDAMLKRGYTPTNPDDKNWRYCISKRSPCFKKNCERKPYCNEIMPKFDGNR